MPCGSLSASPALDVAGIELSPGAPRLRGHEGSAVATGGVLPPQLPHHFLRQHRHELRRRGVDASSGTAEQRAAAKRTPVLRRLAAGYRPHPLTPGVLADRRTPIAPPLRTCGEGDRG